MQVEYGWLPNRTAGQADSEYSYAWDNAFVLLPAECVQKLQLTPNIADRPDTVDSAGVWDAVSKAHNTLHTALATRCSACSQIGL